MRLLSVRAASVRHLPRAAAHTARAALRAQPGQALAGMTAAPGIGTCVDPAPAEDALLFPGADEILFHAATALDALGTEGRDSERGALTRSIAQSGRAPTDSATGPTESERFALAERAELGLRSRAAATQRAPAEAEADATRAPRPRRGAATNPDAPSYRPVQGGPHWANRVYNGNNTAQLASNRAYRALNGGSASRITVDGYRYATSGWW